MKFELKIDCNNDAFERDTEVARIIRTVASFLDGNPFPDEGMTLQDNNGNTVGFARFKK